MSTDLHPSPDNLRAYSELIQTLLDPGAVAFVGAGVSVEAGYPTWKDLLERFHEKAIELQVKATPRELEQIGRMDDLLWRAEEYRRLLDPTAYTALMWDFFRPRPRAAAPTAAALAKLPFKHYLTTNYDPLLETACASEDKHLKVIEWTQSAEVQQFLRNVNLKERHFVYLHGRFNKPESIVLSERDYVRRYATSDETPRKLFTLFATQRLVFVGFSLSDPDLAFVLRSVNAAFSAIEAQHFLLAPIGLSEDESVHRRKFRGKHGVNPVFFISEADKTYAALPRVLKDIQTWLSQPTRASADTFAEEIRRSTFKGRTTRTKRLQADPDDPYCGFADGRSFVEGIKLTGTVAETEEPDWFTIKLQVVGPPNSKKLGTKVKFLLHPTFHPNEESVDVKNGKAEWEGSAYGAFTVGAETEGGVKLELNLAELPNAPKRFRER